MIAAPMCAHLISQEDYHSLAQLSLGLPKLILADCHTTTCIANRLGRMSWQTCCLWRDVRGWLGGGVMIGLC